MQGRSCVAAPVSAGGAGSSAPAGCLLPAVVGPSALPVFSAGAGGGRVLSLAAVAASLASRYAEAARFRRSAAGVAAPVGLCVFVVVPDAGLCLAAAGN